MNRGHVLQSSPVQQMMAAGNPNWWNINSMRAPITTNQQPSSSPFLPPHPHHPSFLLPQFPPSSSLPFLPSWHDNNNNNQNQNQELPESWSQLLLGGLVCEDDKANSLRQLIHQAKKLEDWEEHILSTQAHPIAPVNVDVKRENSSPGSFVYGHHGTTGNNINEDFHSLSQIMTTSSTTAASVSSPKSSCVTSFGSNMLDFSNKSEARHPPPSRSSSECNSSATGGAVKKARVQPSSSSAQPTFKVRKEKLGDRITALHQLVSPFGKTDTASVLLEAIGYIRFLQNQIEALSLPYLGSGSPNMRLQQQQHQSAVHGERNCMFPEDPGQLLNDNCMKMKGVNSEQDAYQEPKKDLRSRGLCLVPVSCTLQVGSDNGADYWAPAALGGGFQ